MNGGEGRLDSWKEIAAYLKHDIRTVQRWEAVEHMPVHRHMHSQRSSVYAYQAELDQWWMERIRRTTESTQIAAAPRFRRRWKVLALAGVLAAALGMMGVWREAPPSLSSRALTSAAGVESFPSFSPDGTRVVYSWLKPGESNPDLFVAQVQGGEPVQITATPTRAEVRPKWSPDGQWIAYFGIDEGERQQIWLMVVPSGGGEGKRICSDNWTGSTGLAWTADSQAVIAAIPHARSPGESLIPGLQVVRLDSGQARQLLRSPPNVSFIRPVVSGDGKALAYLSVENEGILRKAHVVGLSSGYDVAGSPVPIEHKPIGNIEDLAWVGRERRLLYTVAGSASGGTTGFWTVPANGIRAQPKLLFPVPGAQSLHGGLSPDGTRLAYRALLESSTGFWRVPLVGDSTGEVEPHEIETGASTANNLNIAISPDGRSMAFVSNRSGGLEIWTAGVDGSFPRQLTNRPGEKSGTPRWSPDGQWIAFDGSTEGNSDLFVVRATGGAPRRVTSAKSVECNVSWSTDGQWVYFGSDRTGEFQVYRVPVQGGQELQVTREGGFGGVESPYGDYFYYTTHYSAGQLRRVPVWGGKEEVLLPGIQNIHGLRATRKGVYFMPVCPECQKREKAHMLNMYRLPNGPVEIVTQFRMAIRMGFSVAADDSFMIVNAIRPSAVQRNVNVFVVEGLR